jgi:hypothetical protein
VRKVVEILISSRDLNSHSPLMHHVLGFAMVVLVRLSNMVEARDEACQLLHDLVGERKVSQFDQDRFLLMDGYDIIAKRLLDYNRGRRLGDMSLHPNHHRESESHYNDSNGIGRLAHLADLAVGEGADGQYSDRQTHKIKSEALRDIGGEEGLHGIVKRQGYLSALQTLLQNS